MDSQKTSCQKLPGIFRILIPNCIIQVYKTKLKELKDLARPWLLRVKTRMDTIPLLEVSFWGCLRESCWGAVNLRGFDSIGACCLLIYAVGKGTLPQ